MSFHVLPRDVLADILLLLPMKSLVSCACSCKYLFAFVLDPFFTAMLAKRSVKNPSIFFRYYSRKKFKQYYSLLPDNSLFNVGNHEMEMPIDCCYGRCFNIVGSLNGVICLSDDLYTATNVIILWNPSIRKSLELPAPSITMDTHGDMGVVVGFGYGLDGRVFDYKVVRLAYIGNNCHIGNRAPPIVEVYSVKTRSWKCITSNGPMCDIRTPTSCPIYSHSFVRRSCHWPGWRGNVWNSIVTFDMTDEVFGVIKLPRILEGCKCCDVDLKVLQLGLRNMLALIHMEHFFHQGSKRVPANGASIWVMRQYGVVDSWVCVFKYSRPVDHPMPRLFFFRNNMEILSLMGGSNLHSERMHTLYSMKTNMGLGQVKGKPFGFQLTLYMESLALLKEGRSVPVTALERSVTKEKIEGEEGDDTDEEVIEYEGSDQDLSEVSEDEDEFVEDEDEPIEEDDEDPMEEDDEENGEDDNENVEDGDENGGGE